MVENKYYTVKSFSIIYESNDGFDVTVSDFANNCL